MLIQKSKKIDENQNNMCDWFERTKFSFLNDD